MACKSVSQLAVGEIPDLDGAVPGGGDDGRLEIARTEADAADPVRVSLAAVAGDGVLALPESVPELDGAVAGG